VPANVALRERRAAIVVAAVVVLGIWNFANYHCCPCGCDWPDDADTTCDDPLSSLRLVFCA
jgi:hypothetical protein